MKKTVLGAITLMSLVIACKSKKSVPSTQSNESSIEAQLTAVKARFPDATKEELQRGHSIFTGACTKCHGTKNVTKYTEEKLLGIVDVMAKKAELTSIEKQALIRFAVGVRATAK